MFSAFLAHCSKSEVQRCIAAVSKEIFMAPKKKASEGAASSSSSDVAPGGESWDAADRDPDEGRAEEAKKMVAAAETKAAEMKRKTEIDEEVKRRMVVLARSMAAATATAATVPADTEAEIKAEVNRRVDAARPASASTATAAMAPIVAPFGPGTIMIRPDGKPGTLMMRSDGSWVSAPSPVQKTVSQKRSRSRRSVSRSSSSDDSGSDDSDSDAKQKSRKKSKSGAKRMRTSSDAAIAQRDAIAKVAIVLSSSGIDPSVQEELIAMMHRAVERNDSRSAKKAKEKWKELRERVCDDLPDSSAEEVRRIWRAVKFSSAKEKGGKEKDEFCEWCKFKKMKGWDRHTDDTCWKLHPEKAPDWWNKNNGNDTDRDSSRRRRSGGNGSKDKDICSACQKAGHTVDTCPEKVSRMRVLRARARAATALSHHTAQNTNQKTVVGQNATANNDRVLEAQRPITNNDRAACTRNDRAVIAERITNANNDQVMKLRPAAVGERTAMAMTITMNRALHTAAPVQNGLIPTDDMRRDVMIANRTGQQSYAEAAVGTATQIRTDQNAPSQKRAVIPDEDQKQTTDTAAPPNSGAISPVHRKSLSNKETVLVPAHDMQ
jgi:hypothetical protein